MFTDAVSTLARADESIRAECQRLVAEICAFERFIRQVSDLTPDSPVVNGTDGGHLAVRTVSETGDSPSFRAIRQAYRRTVLEVDHWQDTYDESTVAESVTAEFSPDLAELIVQPRSTGVSPALKSRLVEESRRSVGMRERTLALLDTEADEIDRVRGELKNVARLAEEARGDRVTFESRERQLRRARAELGDVLDSHQSYLHGRSWDRHDPLVQSVYADMDVNRDPGLSAITSADAELQRLELRHWTGRGATSR